MRNWPGRYTFALLVPLILSFGCVAPHVITRTDLPAIGKDKEMMLRQKLNDHIIAINEDGLAIEPYSYRYDGRYWGAGFVKPHWGGEVRLQTHVRNAKGSGITALKALGYDTNQIEHLTNSLPINGFVFRDVVVSNILAKARASGKSRIVVYVHGGLNNLDDAIERAERMLLNAEGDPKSNSGDSYPIFICWPSALGSSYHQHLTGVRNGVDVRHDNKWWTFASMPIYAVADVGTSLARLPRVMFDLSRVLAKSTNPYGRGDVQDGRGRYYTLRYSQFCLDAEAQGITCNYQAWTNSLQQFERIDLATLLRTLRKELKFHGNDNELWTYLAGNTVNEWRDIVDGDKDNHPVDVSMGQYEPNQCDLIRRSVCSTLQSPTKLAAAGVLSATGTESWGIMCRRVNSMYYHESSFRPALALTNASGFPHYEETDPDVAGSTSTGVGAMAVFLRALERAQKSSSVSNCINHVEIYGHSMGAIVINRGLQQFPHLNLDKIVFMSAACSMKDFSDSVIPYLESHAGANTHFYNLCLNPRAEEREEVAFNFVPRGSLLVWIDTFLQRPTSFDDRVLGHFENAMLGSHMFPPHVQKRIHITAMAAGVYKEKFGELQTHGSFNGYRFWDKSFVEAPGWESEKRNESRLRDVKNGRLLDSEDRTK